MANVIYNSFKKKLMDGEIDLVNDTIKVALVTSGYTPDIDNHDYFDDITNEVSGTGYTAGGETLTNKSVTQNNTTDKGVFDADDVTWSNSTITARGAVLYKSTGTDSTSPLIAYFDFGSDQSTTGADFVLRWNSSGIIDLS